MNRAFVAGAAACLIVCAATVVPASAGVLDVMQSALSSATVPIETNAARWSNVIFYTFVFAEFIYLLYRGMFMHDWHEFLDAWVQRIVFFCFGVLVLQNQVALTDAFLGWINQIASDFVFAGQAAAITPDGLMSIGWNLSDAVCRVQNWNPIVNTALVIPQQFAGLALTLAYLLVAIEYLVVQVGAQFCVAVAGVAVGLLATRWTRPFSGVLPRVLFSTLILTVTIDAVAAVGVNIGNAMMAMIAAADTGSMSGMLNAFITITAAAAAYFVFALGIPSLVGFLGATRPMPGGAAMMSSFASVAAYAAGRGSAGSGGGGSSGKPQIAQLEAATKTA